MTSPSNRIESYPGYIDECALVVGFLRDQANEDISHLDYFRREEDVNTIGIKAELIAQHHLHSLGYDFESAPLVEQNPVPGPDIIVADYHIDVKAIPHYGKRLSVNERAHQKTKGITHYWFFHFQEDGSVKMYWKSYEEVNNWPVRQLKYTPAYCLDIPK